MLAPLPALAVEVGAAAVWPALVTLCLVFAFAASSSSSRADEVEGVDVPVPSSPAAGPPAPDATSDGEKGDWRLTVAPYAWFPFIVGSTTIMDQSDEVDIQFDQLWEQLHMALFLDVDVQKGRFGVLTDLFYSYLWNRTQQGPLTYESKIRLVIFDFALFYEALSMDLGSGPKAPKLRLQPLFGGRYVYGIIPTTVQPVGRRLEPTSNTAAPVLGLRGFLDIDDQWNISFHGDGGGWGVDDLDVTWQAELLGGYRWHFSRLDFNLMVGYKALGMKVTDEISSDLILHGPVLRLGFEF